MSIIENYFFKKHEDVLNAVEPNSVVYAFEIYTPSEEILRLNSSGKNFYLEKHIFLSFSSLTLVRAEFDDSAENEIFISGVFERNGIEKDMNLAGCKIKIYPCLGSKKSSPITYFITEFIKGDLDFIIKCEPPTAKYNRSILLLYSKTCRADFGDRKCSVPLESYIKSYKIQSVNSKVLRLKDLTVPSGYYSQGKARFGENIKKSVTFNIVSHYNQEIELNTNVPENFLTYKYVYLLPSCDKNFITCCKKFNNAINFRGEPTLEENNFLDNNEKR